MTNTRNPKYTKQRAHIFRPACARLGLVSAKDARAKGLPTAKRSSGPFLNNKKPPHLRYAKDPVDLSRPFAEYLPGTHINPRLYEPSYPLQPKRPVPCLNTRPFGIYIRHSELAVVQRLARHLPGSQVLPRGNFNFVIITFLPIPEADQLYFIETATEYVHSLIHYHQVSLL